MPINKIPQSAFSNDDMIVNTFTATAGQTAFTLTKQVSVNSVLVHVNDVIQQPTVDYTVSGTTLTLTSGATVGDDVRVRILSENPLGVSGGGGGGSTLIVQDEGSALTSSATAINFVGAGVTASGTGGTKTVTIAGGASQNTFSTVAVSGQNNVVADQANDTLTLVAGSNMTITTNASGDSITFASSGGGGGSGIALTDLSVGSEGTAANNGGVSYNNSTGVFTYVPPLLNGLTANGTTDFGTNKITYSNNYAQLSDLPSASTYHGMFAHVHATGKAYYAHAGNWVPLAQESQLTLDGLTGVSTSGVTSGQVLKYNGTSWAPAADASGSSGIALGDLSVGAEGTASGDGSLAYNNSTGVFTYTPPVIPAVALPDDQEFSVTASGSSAYTFSGGATGNNPTLNLQRGKTYRFDINASGHPFQIRVSNGGSAYTNGVVTQNNTMGAVYFTVPEDAPATLVYQCSVHSAMVGTINCVGKALGTAHVANHQLHVYKSSLNEARIGNVDGGHTFISQTNDNSTAFEIYDQHGSNTTRNALNVATNLSGSKTNLLTVREDGEVSLNNSQTLNGSGALIQTKCKIVNTMASGNPVNTWTEIHSNYRVSIQPKYSDSHIIGNWMIPINPTGASNILMAIVPWVSTDGGTTKYIVSDGITSGSRHLLSQSFFRSNNGYDGNDMQNHIVKFRHDAINTTSSHTYGFYFRSEGNNTTYFCHSSGNNSTWGWTAGMKLELTEVRP